MKRWKYKSEFDITDLELVIIRSIWSFRLKAILLCSLETFDGTISLSIDDGCIKLILA